MAFIRYSERALFLIILYISLLGELSFLLRPFIYILDSDAAREYLFTEHVLDGFLRDDSAVVQAEFYPAVTSSNLWFTTLTSAGTKGEAEQDSSGSR